MDKYAPDDIPNINSTCFKLNSLQLQALLQNYHCAPDEPFVPAVSGAPVTTHHVSVGEARQRESLRDHLTRSLLQLTSVGVKVPGKK